MSDLIAERDGLKDKNEKLKDMCKKYLAKLKAGQIQNPQVGFQFSYSYTI